VIPPPRPIRVPLQVGLASLRSQARATALGWPGTFVFMSSLLAWGFVQSLIPIEFLGIAFGVIAFLIVAVLGMMMWAGSLSAADESRRERPSDLVLHEHGLRVEGGRHAGVSVPWDAIASCTVEPVPKPDKLGLRHTIFTLFTLGLWKKAASYKRQVFRLALRRKAEPEHKPLVLAESDDLDEIESLRALASCIQAVALEEEGGAAKVAEAIDPPPPGAPKLFVCDECAAPLAPADVDVTRCHHCGKDTRTPDDLRARLRAPDEIARGLRAEKQVARLLDQPGAARANVWITLLRYTGRVIWIVGLAALITLAVVQAVRADGQPIVLVTNGYVEPWKRDLWLALGIIAASLVIVGVLGATYLANRRALSLVSLRFGANPPLREGDPYGCRQCAAPLPKREGRVVVGCIYCGVENVVGTDLRRAAARAKGQERSVMEALRHRRRARGTFWAATIASLAVIFLLGRELAFAWWWAPRRERHSTPCIFCKRTTVENLDGSRRLVTLRAKDKRNREVVRRFVVPAKSTFDVECADECVIEVGASRETVEDERDALRRKRPGRYEIRQGRIARVEHPR
jgi:hypothetical protein